jgi:UDP-N-acetylmuramoyl-L-alanyl-D-glutamate--2,6-diaminopimelate ligase
VENSARIGDREINGLTCDSRQVEPGFLFAALPGSQVDGRAFIAQAVANGAVAILAEENTPPSSVPGDAALITAANPRKQYAQTAARFFGAQPRTIAAITGTNGKTSVAGFLRQIWAEIGYASASAGTLGVEIAGTDAGKTVDIKHGFNLTTPDSVDLHRALKELADAEIEHLALEASSHGLDQYRLDGLRVSAAAFTNLTRDHLDYHGTVEAYLDAKTRLFSELLIDGGIGVINADDPYAETFRQACQARGVQVLSYGVNGKDICLKRITPRTHGQMLDVNVMGVDYEINLALTGSFQAMNALCALGLAIGMGDQPDLAVKALTNLRGAPGRVQLAGTSENGAAVYVDYAHTPDALECVLKALRPHTETRLHVVFGCGGDRDAGKRPEMGHAAAICADRVIVTDDNPRSEDPALIRRQTLEGCPGATEIGDRAKAIGDAIDGLRAGDILVVAGKGHETGQVVGDHVYPFDDVSVVQAYLAERL